MDVLSSCVTCSVAALWFHSHAAKLGAQLADLHLENKRRGETLQKEAGRVGMTSCGPRGTPPRGGHWALMGAWVGLCHSHVSEGQTCVDAKGKECQPHDACLGCSEHSERSLSATNGSCEPFCLSVLWAPSGVSPRKPWVA